MADERGLRMTFDSAADLYQLARPEYPEALCEALIAATGPTVGDRLMEIGCATGKETQPLARQGSRMTCVELGPALASAARRNLAGFPEVEVIEAAFETFDRPTTEPFDLVFAATARATWLGTLTTRGERCVFSPPVGVLEPAHPCRVQGVSRGVDVCRVHVRSIGPECPGAGLPTR